MNQTQRLFWVAAVVLMASFALISTTTAQEATSPSASGYRQLAPGVETTIPLGREEKETFAEHDIVELVPGVPDLEWNPQEVEKTKTLYHKSQNVLFRRGVWEFQFHFKPLRMIQVDVPQLDGKMKRELIWYMVYRVTNPGGHNTPVAGEPTKFAGGTYTIEQVNEYSQLTANIGQYYFTPIFLLRTHGTEELKVDQSTVQYFDEIIPAARRAIYLRERPACEFREFHDTVTISSEPVPVSQDRQKFSRWGVVMWRGIDPTVDFVTIQIMGLTNAYQWADPAGAFKPGDPPGTGRLFVYKTLQLNFYRPGDEFAAREQEIQFGVDGHPEWQWVWRPNPTTHKPVKPTS